MSLIAKTLVRTCEACPAQWEGKLDDGRMFYIRFRWGGGSLRVSPEETDDVVDAVRGEEIAYFEKGDGLDGCLSEEEMREHLKDYIEFRL